MIGDESGKAWSFISEQSLNRRFPVDSRGKGKEFVRGDDKKRVKPKFPRQLILFSKMDSLPAFSLLLKQRSTDEFREKLDGPMPTTVRTIDRCIIPLVI